MTREQLDELDLTDGDTHIIAYIDRLTAERDRLEEALRLCRVYSADPSCTPRAHSVIFTIADKALKEVGDD